MCGCTPEKRGTANAEPIPRENLPFSALCNVSRVSTVDDDRAATAVQSVHWLAVSSLIYLGIHSLIHCD